MLATSIVIAVGRNIGDLERLIKTYGGPGRMWKKKTTMPFDKNGELVEIHWYEHPNFGKVELKLKGIGKL